MKALILVAVLLLSGCAGISPYVEGALAYPIDSETDYWLQTDRSWQCSSGPQAHIEVGVTKGDEEQGGALSLGVHHQSWLLCGGPLNDKPEVDQNDIRLKYRKEW
jgi:uncharacterized protein YceK